MRNIVPYPPPQSCQPVAVYVYSTSTPLATPKLLHANTTATPLPTPSPTVSLPTTGSINSAQNSASLKRRPPAILQKHRHSPLKRGQEENSETKSQTKRAVEEGGRLRMKREETEEDEDVAAEALMALSSMRAKAELMPDLLPRSAKKEGGSEEAKDVGKGVGRRKVRKQELEQTRRRTRGAVRMRSAVLQNTSGCQPLTFLDGFRGFQAKKSSLLPAARRGGEALGKLRRMTDQWEKKKKALALIHWGEIGTLARELKLQQPGEVAELEEFYKILDAQSVLIRGHPLCSYSEGGATASPWRVKVFDMQVRTFRRRMVALVGFSHGLGRLPHGNGHLEFLRFRQEKEALRANAALHPETLDHHIKILADRWERRKKSLAFNSVNLLMDALFISIHNRPQLARRPGIAQLIHLMNGRRQFISGVDFWPPPSNPPAYRRPVLNSREQSPSSPSPSPTPSDQSSPPPKPSTSTSSDTQPTPSTSCSSYLGLTPSTSTSSFSSQPDADCSHVDPIALCHSYSAPSNYH